MPPNGSNPHRTVRLRQDLGSSPLSDRPVQEVPKVHRSARQRGRRFPGRPPSEALRPALSRQARQSQVQGAGQAEQKQS